MLVRITPPGRRARVFRVSGVKRSWHIDGGCAAATIPLALSAEDTERIALARVDLFGPLGLEWAGMVWRKPRAGEAIECAGLANALTFTRRTGIFADTRVADLQEWNGTNWGAYKRSVSGGVVTILQSPGTTASAGDTAGYYYWGDAPLYNLRLSGNMAHNSIDLHIATSATEGAATSTAHSNTGTGAFGPVNVNLGGARGYVIYGRTPVTSTPSRSDTYLSVWDITAHGVSGLTTITPEAVIGWCLDALPSWALPAGAAYRAYVGTSGVTISSLVFDDPRTDDKAKIDAVTGLTTHHFGFYARRAGAGRAVVPVYEPVETTPSLALDVTRVADDSLQEASVEAQANNYIVGYTDADGRTRYLEVADTDASNYLNRIGYAIDGAVDASFTSSPTLATAAGTSAAEAARKYSVEGTASIIRARTANGRSVSPLACMPGRMVRVRGLGRDRLLTVVSTEAEGAQVRVTFGRKPTDLAYLATQALGR